MKWIYLDIKPNSILFYLYYQLYKFNPYYRRMNEKISISMHIMNYYLVIYYYNSTSGFKLNIVYKYTNTK